MERAVRWLESKLNTEKNIERFIRYYWIVSTLRLALGITIMMLILIGGYRFGDLIPK